MTSATNKGQTLFFEMNAWDALKNLERNPTGAEVRKGLLNRKLTT